ncbi:hypothetical protein [Kordiimonas marina]|uniref:hypothetical protein n=1 Tax=Kordiimonas marina TaxID=2872312 RepID=UPI001FF1044B|nr:hypothetical protein [Kordiimonas marina]MCJ9430328.1 hypothetical protein [Kordiimonas marina]
MTKPALYTAFHLNLAFSSIEEEDRPIVIERCYWPLLHLAEQGFPIGIEMTGYTLRAIGDHSPAWVGRFRELLQEGAAELIASGYTQMIAPLVPPEVTRRNLAYGLADYERILGVRPEIALLNEQAYAPGLVPIYHEMGFKALMMDWAEPASHHREWPAEWSLSPQRIEGADGTVMPVVWSDAMSFQKFQRYAHGEIDPEDYVEFLSGQLGGGATAMPIYTSDAEIFDFRPGRFESEAAQAGTISEFDRIALLLTALKKSDDVELCLPSSVIPLVDQDGPLLHLESAAVPVPVKKQRKYNLVRWGVTGRDDLSLNTNCWRRYEALMARGVQDEETWRSLCRAWASDLRTHITEKRWRKAMEAAPTLEAAAEVDATEAPLPDDIKVTITKRYLSIETPTQHLMLKLFRGLAVQSFGYGPVKQQVHGSPGPEGVVGTLAHGFFKDILYGADFYSGHLVFEPHNSHKVTDLAHCVPEWRWLPGPRAVEVTASVPSAKGPLEKKVRFYVDESRLEVLYASLWDCPVDGVLRLGHITLNPQTFDKNSLYMSCHNGGELPEKHTLFKNGKLVVFDHGRHVSRLVTAQTAQGMTGGYLELGDDRHFVRLEMARTDAAGLGMVTCQEVDDLYFIRASVSLREVDETSVRPSLGAASVFGAPVVRYGIRIGRHD